MSFVQRKITITIKLGKGSFGDGGYDTVTLSGRRVSAQIQRYGQPSYDTAQLRIYGVPMSVMNQITTLWAPLQEFRNNLVTIEAGDDTAGMSVVYSGGILTAIANLQNQPDAFLEIGARSSVLESVKPVPPTSFKGGVDASVVMSQLAKLMGLGFENNGVSVILQNPYFPGTAMAQAQACAEAARVNFTVDNGVLAIWPQQAGRAGDVAYVSPDTGMVGYPSFNGNWMSLKTIFNPLIKFGREIQVSSSIPAASGQWWARVVNDNLESETPGGAWFTELLCGRRNV